MWRICAGERGEQFYKDSHPLEDWLAIYDSLGGK